MTSSPWQLEQLNARLQLGGLAARLNLAEPERGLFGLHVGTHEIRDAELLGLCLPCWPQPDAGGLLEFYRRGRDLIAGYPESSQWPVRVDVVWRAASSAEAPALLAAVDAIVSVRTSLVESRPELAVRSRLAPCEVLRLADAERVRFEPCGGRASAAIVLEAASGPCCLVFRFPESPFSYVEMIHPADFQGATLAPAPGGASVVEVRHGLFAERLEKGVMLRARVRGAIVDRADDLSNACACYRDFSAADPPLGA